MASTLEDCLIALSDANDWHGVIECSSKFDFNEKTKFLWAWPSVECLNWLKDQLETNRIDGILSIGCGSGLLEWLISKTIGIQVAGVEKNRSWWQSKYSPKKFIELKFASDCITKAFLRSCLPSNSNQRAMLFCYFNNRNAFLDYVRAFEGDIIIIVGPTDTHIVTDPNPLNPQFDEDEWSLIGCYKFNDQNSNCIGIYKREKSKMSQ